MARVISAFALAILGLCIVLLGSPIHFFAFVTTVVILCLHEFYTILKKGSEPSFMWFGVVAGVLLTAIIYSGNATYLISFIGGFVVISFSAALLLGRDDPIKTGSNTIFGVIYIAGTLACLTVIREAPLGDYYIILLITANSFCDIFAYYTGKMIGKTPLAPKVSPKKTVEGLIGGVGGAMVGSIGVKLLFIPSLEMHHAAIIGLLIGAFGPMGDLTESAIKRKMDVKDSGWILPGHGGMLDRADALLFSGTAFYIYLKLALAL